MEGSPEPHSRSSDPSLHTASIHARSVHTARHPRAPRYNRYVAPGAALVDQAALERLGERWELERSPGPPFPGPALVVAARLDSTVGYAAAAELLGDYQRATLAVVDDAGHALPHERPELLRALVVDWLDRVGRWT